MKNNSKDNVISKIEKIARPIAEELNLSIWNIRFLKEGSNWYLRIFIDKDNGISIEDCENFSRAIDKPLDELDPISCSYSLEVCSPGLERELINPEHFQQFINSPIKIRTIRPYEDKKRDLNGILKSYENGIITVETNDEKTLQINKKDTAFVKLDDLNL